MTVVVRSFSVDDFGCQGIALLFAKLSVAPAKQ